jgi:hypothetical protein
MKNYLYIFCAFLLLCSSCSEDFFDQVVEVDVPEHEPALAITSTLANSDSILWAYVTNSVGILEPDNPGGIEDATVELYKDGSLFQTLSHIQQGYYGWEIESALGDSEAEYELRVSKDGFTSVFARQIMPRQVAIKEAIYEKDGTVDFDGERVDELIVRFDDKGAEDNYYKLTAKVTFQDSDGNSYESDLYLDTNDPSLQDTYDGLYFSDGVFNGNEAEIRLYAYGIYIDEDPAYINPKVVFELSHLTKDKYFREISVYNYDPENPFAEPTIIYSNIENGYGIFSLEALGPAYEIDL